MKISDLESAVKYLKSFTSYEDIIIGNYDDKAFDLSRFRRFLRKYGVRYDRVRAIHIAGSKGKGTTASLLAGYLQKQGKKVGLFISPYVLSITDSIEIDGVPISEDRFLKYVRKLQKFIDKEKIVEKGKMVTYFELLTTIMFQYFLDEGVGFAVLEVGLGGRLDSTNVCKPVSTVLTSVEKEHEELLGDTYREILNEKLGIVKKGVPLIVSPQKGIVKADIKKRRLKVPVIWAREGDPNYEGAKACLFDLVGRGIIDEFDERLFLKIYHNLSIVGRFEVEKFRVGGASRTAIFDIAHTVDSGRYLRARLDREFPDADFRFLISMMKDKDVDGFLDVLVGKDLMGRFRSKKHEVTFTNSHTVRGHDASDLKKRFCKEASVVVDPIEAFRGLLAGLKKDQVLVVTGSHFLVGEVLRVVKRRTY
jgi:folylpolyglutamate synthase/dihydropteroate synthase